MTQLAEDRLAPASPPPGGTPWLLRRLCTSNPFYVLSALLVCLGLWHSFGAQEQASQTLALMLGMGGYTLLLAATACLLVRLLGVWDDVRTVMLLVVLMFLATSVTFDEVLARDPGRGIACYLAGLVFAAAVSEAMLRGSRLELPALFRVPYYLALGLFFLYPVAVTPLLDQPGGEALPWALFGFSPAAGLVALSLLPAVRRGRAYAARKGTPWPWAWYPWTLFAVLAFAVPARSALLCWSMHHVALGAYEPYIFGPYFLVPFLLAVGVVLLELGLVERHRGVLRVALMMPVLLVVLAGVGHRPDPIYREFLAHVIARLGGTPLFLTLLAAAAFYGYAAVRRVPRAGDALTGALAALAVVAPTTLEIGDWTSPRPWPLLAIATLQLGLGLRRGEAVRCLVGASCLAMVAAIVPQGSGILSHRGPIAFHLILLAVLAVGAAFDDAMSRRLRALGAGMVLLASFTVLSGRITPPGSIPAWVVAAYPLAMGAMIVGYGLLLGHRPSVAMAGLILTGWLGMAGWQGYAVLRRAISGLDTIAAGLFLFTLAVLTSMVKGGAAPWKIAGRWLTPASRRLARDDGPASTG